MSLPVLTRCPQFPQNCALGGNSDPQFSQRCMLVSHQEMSCRYLFPPDHYHYTITLCLRVERSSYPQQLHATLMGFDPDTEELTVGLVGQFAAGTVMPTSNVSPG